jgi:proteasome maturation protein
MERLPGLPSSKLGLQAITGALEDFGFDDYLRLPSESEVAPPDLHSQMEQRLGMAANTKPMARGLPS